MIKPSGAAVVLALVGVLLVGWRARGVARAVAAIVGLCVPIGAVAAWTAHAGLLGEMPALIHQCALYASQTPMDAGAWGMLGLAMLVLGGPIVLRWRSGRGADGEERAERSIVWFALAWFALELIGVVLQRRMYAYYFLVLAPPAALVFGVVSREARLGPARLGPVALGLVPVMALSLAWGGRDLLQVWRGVDRLPVSRYLMEHARPGEAVWADQMSRLLIETNLRPGAAYAHIFYFTNYDEAPLDYSRQLLADFEARRPAYIVLRKDLDEQLKRQALGLVMLSDRPRRRENFFEAWRQVREYVGLHYRAEAEVDGQVVYRRAS